jgi:hypothetical protein
VRAETERRAALLSPEDQVVQSMPDASPTKWHRAHTTWFLEQFLLAPRPAGYRVFNERFAYLFNSYYVAAGPRQARPRRGLLTRPDCEDVTAFRAHVDEAVERLLAVVKDRSGPRWSAFSRSVFITSSSQELLLTDILHAFAQSPVSPAYDPDWRAPRAFRVRCVCRVAIGHPHCRFRRQRILLRQRRACAWVYLQPAHIGRGLVTNAQWLEFMADGVA